MIPRQMMLDLITEIQKRPEHEFAKLDSKDKTFWVSICKSANTYGYSFTQKQFDYLQLIYRKVYANV